MDGYFLNKEDWDSMVELGVGSRRDEDILKMISSATKATFTRKCVPSFSAPLQALLARPADHICPPSLALQLQQEGPPNCRSQGGRHQLQEGHPRAQGGPGGCPGTSASEFASSPVAKR